MKAQIGIPLCGILKFCFFDNRSGLFLSGHCAWWAINRTPNRKHPLFLKLIFEKLFFQVKFSDSSHILVLIVLAPLQIADLKQARQLATDITLNGAKLYELLAMEVKIVNDFVPFLKSAPLFFKKNLKNSTFFLLKALSLGRPKGAKDICHCKTVRDWSDWGWT